uniref:Uncharacterized protein n=1 Tax=Mycena chlorophos TaxID=658473 RepID=A0ABQ0KW85_MYCCL|nr:predicted protein [Mycena chlorophos]
MVLQPRWAGRQEQEPCGGPGLARGIRCSRREPGAFVVSSFRISLTTAQKDLKRKRAQDAEVDEGDEEGDNEEPTSEDEFSGAILMLSRNRILWWEQDLHKLSNTLCDHYRAQKTEKGKELFESLLRVLDPVGDDVANSAYQGTLALKAWADAMNFDGPEAPIDDYSWLDDEPREGQSEARNKVTFA